MCVLNKCACPWNPKTIIVDITISLSDVITLNTVQVLCQCTCCISSPTFVLRHQSVRMAGDNSLHSWTSILPKRRSSRSVRL